MNDKLTIKGFKDALKKLRNPEPFVAVVPMQQWFLDEANAVLKEKKQPALVLDEINERPSLCAFPFIPILQNPLKKTPS